MIQGDDASSSSRSVEEILTELQTLYESHDRGSDYRSERPVFAQLLPPLLKDLHPMVLLKPFGLGSTATVWQVHDPTLKQTRALKLARPRQSKLAEIIRVIRAERDRLASLTHQNITKIYFANDLRLEIEGESYSFPYFLMDYLPGVRDLDEYLNEHFDTLVAEQVISYFRHVALGISFLHRNHIIHCDIKPANLLIASGSPALVADLGYAKHLEPVDESPRLTSVVHTPQYAHPDLRRRLVRSTDPNANVAEIPRSDLRVAYDLFAFGRTLQQMLALLRSKDLKREDGPALFTPYQWRYLSLIAMRLLDGVVEHQTSDALTSDVLPGLLPTAMKEVAYVDADTALEDLEKLLNLYDLEGEIPELNASITSYVQIPPDTPVPLTPRVAAVIHHPTFARLTQLSQLGFVSLVYPGATHTRYEHALGAFEKCCAMVRALWYDPVSCIFRSLMSRGDIEALLVSSLLHDLGQCPMSHDLAEIHATFDHERLTSQLLYGVVEEHEDTLADLVEQQWRVDPGEVMAILRATAESGVKHRVLNSIISGPLDCDKLDYLQRDSVHAGVSFGQAIGTERLLRNVTVCLRVADDQLQAAEIGVSEKALAVAEGIWRARRDMFRQMYWHHTVRSLKAMLAFVVRRILSRCSGEAERARFASEFRRFVISPMSFYGWLPEQVVAGCPSPSGADAEQLDALGIRMDHVIGPGSGSALCASDDAVIWLLWPYADEMERSVLQMIRRREVFQRLAVISHSRQADEFARIYDWHRLRQQDGDVRKLEQARAALEAEILERCPSVAETSHAAHGADLVTTRPALPVILVDVPVRALYGPPTKEALWFVPEEELHLRPDAAVTFPIPRESAIQIEQAAFDRDVGKVRVLCHPTVYDVLQTAISAPELTKLVVKHFRPQAA